MTMHSPKSSRWIVTLVAVAVSTMLVGCVANPVQPQKDKVAAATAGPLYFPPLPNPPRIQHLVTIASERDIAVKKNSFADFIVGEERQGQRLVQPYGVAMYRNTMYVADTGAGGIAIFDLVRQKYGFMSGTGGGRMKRPINIRIDADGTRYVTDTGREQILVFDKEDRFLRAFGTHGQFRPVDVAIVGNRIYVTDIAHHEIHVLDKLSGQELFKFGKAGSAPGELFHPTNIALGPDGDIYVVETSNFRVQRFTPEGKSVRFYGEVGSALGNFARPKGIAIDKQGHMLVSDAAFQNVQIFDTSGKLLLFFGQSEDHVEASINLPAGVSIDYDNIAAFRRYADPNFKIEYLVFVASQFGPNKIDIYGFGKMEGMAYPSAEQLMSNNSQL